MSDKFSFRGGDTEGAADGDYVLTVTGGHVTGLTSAPSGGGSGVVETIVPGTGIAVDSTDPANPIVSATGGGGGGVGNDPRWNVQSGQTTVDEFNDSSLAAAWTRVDGIGAVAGTVTWAEGGDTLSVLNNGGDTNGAFHGLMRPIGTALSAGEGFLTFARLMAPAANYGMASLCLSDGTTHGSGSQVHAAIVRTSTDMYFEPWAGTSWTSAVSIGTAFQGSPPVTAGLFFKLVMTAANTWRASMSPDGVLWFDCPTGTKTLTPTHVGFATTSRGTATKHIGSFEMLRRI